MKTNPNSKSSIELEIKMVVLSAAITTRTGKALIARQFVDMTRMRIEGLLAVFPKLIGSNKQHTFVETESVRYVYQPLEGLLLLLITTKTSNIIEDLETLRLLAKVVPKYCGGLSEELVTNNAFDLIFAIDEVITLGYREDVNITQIQKFLEMDSHEEKLHELIRKSKEREADEERRRAEDAIRERQKQMARAERQQNRLGLSGFDAAAARLGLGSGSSMESMGFDTRSSGFGSNSLGTIADISRESNKTPEPSIPTNRAKGMQFGSSGGQMDNLLKAIGSEDPFATATNPRPSGSSTKPATAPPPVSSRPVSLILKEELTLSMSREGAINNMEIKGTLSLMVNDSDFGQIQIGTDISGSKGFQLQPHPNVNKPLFNEAGIIALRDSSRSFPTGTPVGVLRWRRATTDDSELPLNVVCWPDVAGDEVNVNVEYDLRKQLEFRDVAITVPLGTTSSPQVLHVDGSHVHDSRAGVLVWQIDIIDAQNSTGRLEFNIAGRDVDAFFPVQVSFTSPSTLYDFEVTEVRKTTNEEEVSYDLHRSLNVEGFIIE